MSDDQAKPFRILPEVTPENEHFWRGGAEGELRLLRCSDCAEYVHPPAPVCGGCLSTKLAPEAAMAESFMLGGQAIQALARDPLLPEEILPTRDRDALVRALREYDALGRACWATLLDRFDVLHRATPLDTRAADGLERLFA